MRGVDSTLRRLYVATNGSRELIRKAHGVPAFLSVIDAGFMVGQGRRVKRRPRGPTRSKSVRPDSR